jgi:hypothetical protein
MKKTADNLSKPQEIAAKLKKAKKGGALNLRMEEYYLDKLEKLGKFHGIKPATLAAQVLREYLDLYAG